MLNSCFNAAANKQREMSAFCMQRNKKIKHFCSVLLHKIKATAKMLMRKNKENQTKQPELPADTITSLHVRPLLQ